jgi:hypothetical protein
VPAPPCSAVAAIAIHLHICEDHLVPSARGLAVVRDPGRGRDLLGAVFVLDLPNQRDLTRTAALDGVGGAIGIEGIEMRQKIESVKTVCVPCGEGWLWEAG